MVLALIPMDLSNNIMDLSNKTLEFSNNTMDFSNKTMDLFNIAMDFSNNLTNTNPIKSSPLKNSGGFIPIQNPFKTKNKNLFKKKKKTKITPKDPWKESGKTYYSQQQNTVSAKSPSLLDNVSN